MHYAAGDSDEAIPLLIPLSRHPRMQSLARKLAKEVAMQQGPTATHEEEAGRQPRRRERVG